MGTTYFKRDEWVQDAMGNPVSGVQVFLCAQPANTSIVPPSPLVATYADAAGTQLLTKPFPMTNAYGHCEYYAPPGVYTVVYYSTQIAGQTFSLPDQIILADVPQFNSDSTANGTILPRPNGTTKAFYLSGPPNPPQSLVLMVNGLVQNAYAFSGSQVVLQTAPLPGDVITATYQI